MRQRIRALLNSPHAKTARPVKPPKAKALSKAADLAREYTVEHCQALLEQDPEGTARLFLISQGLPLKVLRSRLKTMRRVKKAFAALAGIAAFCWLIRITPPIVHAVNFWTPVNSPLLDDYLPVTPSVTLADTSALNWRFATQPLGATYHIYARLNCTTNTNSGSYACGIYLYDGTKVEGLEALWSQTGGRPGLRVETMTNVSTDAATLVGPTNGIVGAGLTLSIIDDGVHRTFYYWMTGAFHQLYQEPTGTFLTPTSAGFGGATAGNNAGSVMGIQCLIWSVAP